MLLPFPLFGMFRNRNFGCSLLAQLTVKCSALLPAVLTILFTLPLPLCFPLIAKIAEAPVFTVSLTRTKNVPNVFVPGITTEELMSLSGRETVENVINRALIYSLHLAKDRDH